MVQLEWREATVGNSQGFRDQMKLLLPLILYHQKWEKVKVKKWKWKKKKWKWKEATDGNSRPRLPRPNEIAAAAAINNEWPKMLLPSIINCSKKIILVLLRSIMNYQKLVGAFNNELPQTQSSDHWLVYYTDLFHVVTRVCLIVDKITWFIAWKHKYIPPYFNSFIWVW